VVPDGREVAELESQDLGWERVLYSLEPCIPAGKGFAAEAEVLVQLIVTELSDTWDSLSLACVVREETMLTPWLRGAGHTTLLPIWDIVRKSS
jgi:hypothetical protein